MCVCMCVCVCVCVCEGWSPTQWVPPVKRPGVTFVIFFSTALEYPNVIRFTCGDWGY